MQWTQNFVLVYNTWVFEHQLNIGNYYWLNLINPAVGALPILCITTVDISKSI